MFFPTSRENRVAILQHGAEGRGVLALKILKGKLKEEGLRELRVSGVQAQGQIKEPNPLTVRFSNLRNKFLNFPGSFCREFEGGRNVRVAPLSFLGALN